MSTSRGERVSVSTRGNVSGHHNNLLRLQQPLYSTSTEDNETKSATATKKKKKLGLLTFDLGKNVFCQLFVCAYRKTN